MKGLPPKKQSRGYAISNNEGRSYDDQRKITNQKCFSTLRNVNPSGKSDQLKEEEQGWGSDRHQHQMFGGSFHLAFQCRDNMERSDHDSRIVTQSAKVLGIPCHLFVKE